MLVHQSNLYIANYGLQIKWLSKVCQSQPKLLTGYKTGETA